MTTICINVMAKSGTMCVEWSGRVYIYILHSEPVYIYIIYIILYVCVLINIIMIDDCANDVPPCHTCTCTYVIQLSGIPALVRPWINGMTEVCICEQYE